ncbi:TRAP transporter substrate-binding protein DctP, partial [Chloroflexota bacterium]
QLATFGYDSHQLWTTKEVKTLDDFKGLKLRTFGAFAKLIDALGATPISMPSGDAYTSIQKGVLDGLHWAPETVFRWKIHEVIKYKTRVDFGAIGSNALIMNMDVWNEMPDDIQKTVLQLGQDFVVHEYQQIMADDATYNEAFKEAGVVLNSMSDADLAKIKAYASEVETTQGAPALKFLKIARELAPKWDAEAAQIAK